MKRHDNHYFRFKRSIGENLKKVYVNKNEGVNPPVPGIFTL